MAGDRPASTIGVGAIALLVAIVAGLAWWSPRSRPVAHRDMPGLSERSRAAPAGPAAAEPPPASSAAAAGPTLDRAKRDQLRSLIWHAIGQSAPPAPAPSPAAAYVFPSKPPWETARALPPGEGGEVVGHIESKYIQERVRGDFFPLASKCYGDALGAHPDLGGRVVFAFNIVGDPKTGGIVEAVDVLDESTLRDPDVIDCMRQSFLSVTFPPPENGGEVTVVYPVEFSNDDGG